MLKRLRELPIGLGAVPPSGLGRRDPRVLGEVRVDALGERAVEGQVGLHDEPPRSKGVRVSRPLSRRGTSRARLGRLRLGRWRSA